MSTQRDAAEGSPADIGVTPTSTGAEASIADWIENPSGEVRRRLEVWPDGALVVARNLVDGPIHRAFGATVKLAMAGPFRLERGSGDPLETSAATTRPGAPHRMDASGTTFVDLVVDPESDDFAKMAGVFAASEPVRPLPKKIAVPLCRQVRTLLLEGRSGRHVADVIVDALSQTSGDARTIDPRVRRTARYLKEHFGDGWRLSELASRVGLSEGRLSHLFREEMGVSVQAYVTWLRVRDVVYAVASGESLTTAAHASGFSDLPHLTRTFRSMFGEPPSILLPKGGEPVLSFDLTEDASSSAHAETDSERIDRVRRYARTRR